MEKHLKRPTSAVRINESWIESKSYLNCSSEHILDVLSDFYLRYCICCELGDHSTPNFHSSRKKIMLFFFCCFFLSLNGCLQSSLEL